MTHHCIECPFEKRPKTNDVCLTRCEARTSYLKYLSGVIPKSEIKPRPTDFSNPNFPKPYVHPNGSFFFNSAHYTEVAEALQYADETEMFTDILAGISLVQAVKYFESHGFDSTTESIRRRCVALDIKLNRQKDGRVHAIYM